MNLRPGQIELLNLFEQLQFEERHYKRLTKKNPVVAHIDGHPIRKNEYDFIMDILKNLQKIPISHELNQNPFIKDEETVLTKNSKTKFT